MRHKVSFLLFTFVSVFFINCKSDSHQKSKEEIVTEEIVDNDAVNLPLANNLYARIKATQELTYFGSCLDSLDYVERLMNDIGPFTVLAVTDEYFKSFLTKDSLYEAITVYKNEWNSIISSHIILNELSSVTIYKSIWKNGGSYEVETLAGKKLIFFKNETDIYVKDEEGLIGKMGKTDIIGANGVVHLIDNLLGSY